MVFHRRRTIRLLNLPLVGLTVNAQKLNIGSCGHGISSNTIDTAGALSVVMYISFAVCACVLRFAICGHARENSTKTTCADTCMISHLITARCAVALSLRTRARQREVITQLYRRSEQTDSGT